MTRQSVPQRLHEQMHRLPGVPEHSDGERRHRRGGFANRPLQNRTPKGAHSTGHRVMKAPRVLVGWQNAIGRLFSGRDK